MYNRMLKHGIGLGGYIANWKSCGTVSRQVPVVPWRNCQKSLDETYERILREIRKPNQGHAHRLLQCLVAAVRPLEVRELAEVLAFDFNTEGIPKLNLGWRWEDHEEAVMSACSSLVMIVKAGRSRVVQFSHFSVKEFLTANRLAEPIRDVSRYHIRLEAAHTILAEACLGVLQIGRAHV